MGNRCVITTRKDFDSTDGLGVYLHWNGGRDSVEPLLAYCKAKGFRTPESDSAYGYAYLVATIANFFDLSGASVGVGKLSELDMDNWDNGVYIIENWKITGRMYAHAEQKEYDFYEMLKSINEHQPEICKLTEEEIMAIPLPKFYR